MSSQEAAGWVQLMRRACCVGAAAAAAPTQQRMDVAVVAAVQTWDYQRQV
jgi:hypothetical protein